MLLSMQRVKIFGSWVYDVTYDHFCSLQQARAILFLLKEALGRDELPQA